ncbi:MAG: tRNA 2-thiouridine(34) synthase MnmA [Pseudomonadota bacterium]
MKAGGTQRVVVAMSGGVDSSVAALLLKNAGFDVVGISMRLWSYDPEATHGCCTPDDLYDARRVADRLGIPHYVSDFEATFEEKVVHPFLESYRRGETPNPCVRCNTDIKFTTLLQRAEELGATHLATGHYARVEKREGSFHLLRSLNRKKDQSYFLFGLGQNELSKTLFPLGEMDKEDVRKIAQEAKLPVAVKPDSQEICFVPGDYAEFVEKHSAATDLKCGRILNEDGEKLGLHRGIHRYTVGQRKKLPVAKLEAAYVLEVRPDGDIVIGPDAALFKREFSVRECRWIVEPPKEGEEVFAQIRSRFEAAPATIVASGKGTAKVAFREPQRAITPGQAAVIYRGDEVIGGGWIGGTTPSRRYTPPPRA